MLARFNATLTWLAALLLSLTCTTAARAATHPHLFFSSAEETALRADRTTRKAEIATAILAGASAHLADATPTPGSRPDVREHGNVVAVFAFAYVLTGDTRYSAKARALLLTYAKWDWTFAGSGAPDLNRAHMLLGASSAYDWIYNVLSAADRATIAAKIGSEAQAQAAKWPDWYITETVQNHDWIDTAGLGLAALVLQGEDARAPAWLALVKTELGHIAAALGSIGDGSFHEGVPYQAYGLSMSLPFWDALARANADYTDLGMLRGLGKFRLALMGPDGHELMTYGDFYGWSADQSVQVLRTAAARFHDGVAEAAARRWLAVNKRSTYLSDLWYETFEYLAYDPTVGAADVTRQPLDDSLPDLQASVLRSSWSANALTLAFKAGPYGGRSNYDKIKAGGYGHICWGHDHNDDMSFWLYAGGFLAPEAAGYDASNNANYTYKANQTAFHNSLLVDGNGMLGDSRTVGDSEVKYPWFFARDAHTLVAGTGTAHYAVTGASGPGLFAAGTLTRWDRLALLARDRYAVVHDDLASASTHTFDWVCHFPDSVAATASGWIEGLIGDGRALGVRVVAPVNYSASAGTQTAQSLSKFEADGSVGYVHVRPTAAHAAQSFLMVLLPTTTAAWGQKPSITPLSSTEGAGMIVNAAGSTLTEQWIFQTPGGQSRSAGALVLGAARAGLVAYAGGSVARTLLVGAGSVADQSGVRTLLSTAGTGVLEAEFIGTTLSVTGHGFASLTAYGPGVAAVTVNGRAVAFQRAGGNVSVALGAAEP